MNVKPDPLWLHAYSGRENGLMIVGDEAGLKSLGQQLIQASSSGVEVSSDQQWPILVARPMVSGPYKDIRDFSLSFHLGNASSCQKMLPVSRRNIHVSLLASLTILSAIGLISIFRWVAENAF